MLGLRTKEFHVRDDYFSGVLANEKRNRDSSEIAGRDQFNRQHLPTTGLAVFDVVQPHGTQHTIGIHKGRRLSMRARRRVVRSLAPVLGFALAVTLAACGSSSTGTSSSPSAGQAPTQSVAQLAVAAAKEGSLTWYTTFTDKDVPPMVAAFNKVYPKVKVNPLRLSADKIPPRIFVEQKGGKYNADVVSGDSSQISQLLQAGALQPYNAPDESPLPAGLKLPDGYRTVVYATTTVIAYNPTVLQQKGLTAPRSWEDLTKPEWKGQFSIDSSSVNLYDSFVSTMGHAAALKLLTALGNNSPRLVESHTLGLTQVQSGEPIAAATAYGYKASSFKAETPGSVEFVNVNPLPAGLNLIDVVKNAPHPNAAKLFVNWMISQTGQQAIVDITNHTSLRTDVKNDATVWDPTKWPPAWGNPNLPSATYNTYAQEIRTALKAP